MPFRFSRHQPGVFSRCLDCHGAYLTVLVNKNSHPVVVDLQPLEAFPFTQPPKILFSECGGEIIDSQRFLLPPEETLVLKWDQN